MLGLFQVSKGARFHQLNSLHLKYVVELKELLRDSPDDMPDSSALYSVVKNIRQQPEDCLKLISFFDRLIMFSIGTDQAITLCENDIALANQIINQAMMYEQGELSSPEFRKILSDASTQFSRNSEDFEKPISETVDLTITTVITIIICLAALLLSVIFTIFRSIAGIVEKMEAANNALAISERRNRQLANIDSLTELPNRNLFNDRLKQAIAEAKRYKTRFSIMFIDLDRFKHVNDTQGHASGDQLLIEAGERISKLLRGSDTVARFGGDEFITIIESLNDAGDAAIVARKILDAIAKPFSINGVNSYLSASIGIATYPDDAEDEGTLLKNADITMYQAKAKGRNRYEFYRNDLEMIEIRRHTYERELRHAIEKNELLLHFQPVIRLADHKVVGVEALLRWAHGENNLIPPAEFIPIAEDNGQIIEIGEWVLESACQQCMKWRDEKNPNFHIAVNVSGKQLKADGFAKHVSDILSKTGLPANALELEITESLILTEDETYSHILHELSEIGLRLLMDDFGTGYASLSHLRQLPFDLLKIDRSFIKDLGVEGSPLAETIVEMAHSMRMGVVAEGVETQEALIFLKQAGCEYAQGFLFERPVPEHMVVNNKTYKIVTNISYPQEAADESDQLDQLIMTFDQRT